MHKSLIIISALILFFITPLPQVFAAKQGVRVERFESFTLYPGVRKDPYSIIIPLDLKHYGQVRVYLELKSMSKEKLKLYNMNGMMLFRILDRAHQNNKTSNKLPDKFILKKKSFSNPEKSLINYFIDEPELLRLNGKYDIMLTNLTNRTFTGTIFYSYPGSKQEASENWKTNRIRYPDLAVDDIFLTKDHYVAVKIINKGRKNIPEAAWKKKDAPSMVEIIINNKYWGGAGMIVVDPEKNLLKPGSTITYKTRAKISKPTKIEAILDPEHKIKETDEKNNSLIKTLDINQSQQTNNTRLPDLSVKSILLDRNNKIAVRVVNKAKYGVPARFWKAKGKNACTLSLKINGKNWGGATLQGFDPRKKLAKPGGKITYVFNRTLTSKTRVAAIIDSLSVVNERNEKNNKIGVVLEP